MNSRGAGEQGYPVLLLLRSSWILILCPASCAVSSGLYAWLKQISVQVCYPETRWATLLPSSSEYQKCSGQSRFEVSFPLGSAQAMSCPEVPSNIN